MASQIEIARLANVSQSVVSRVLTGRAKECGIADETVTRVQELAKALNYQPNQAAHMLLGRKSKLIGVIIRSFEDQFLATVLDELNRRALQAGYSLLVVGLEKGEFNASEVRLLRNYRPDAFVILGSTDFRSWDDSFLNTGKLIIQIGAPVDDKRIVSCGTDEAEAARLLANHLVSLGHRTFGIVGDNSSIGRLRAGHLRTALAAHGLSIPLPYIYLSEAKTTAAGADAANYYLHDTSRNHWPTAVIATDDLVALTFIRTIGDAGLSVPSNVSIASYDDIAFASLARPALTTIHQPVRNLAATGMEMITGERPPASVLLPPVLRIRESTAAAAVTAGP